MQLPKPQISEELNGDKKDHDMQENAGNYDQNINSISWSENQIYQLRQQIEAYKYMNANSLEEGGNLPKSFDHLQLLTDPEEWALRQATV